MMSVGKRVKVSCSRPMVERHWGLGIPRVPAVERVSAGQAEWPQSGPRSPGLLQEPTARSTVPAPAPAPAPNRSAPAQLHHLSRHRWPASAFATAVQFFVYLSRRDIDFISTRDSRPRPAIPLRAACIIR